MKKRTFLLLEVLIALLLVICCAVPLVTQPLILFRKEVKTLEEVEQERLANWTFTEIKEKLFKNEISWERLPSKGITSPSFPLPPIALQIPGCNSKPMARSYTLSCSGEKTGTHEETYRSFLVRIAIGNKKKYSYRLIVQRKPIPTL
ncbi:MAG TPA: hypothetical protein VLE89_08970 [Chlamydiales bacterium]|nr:hypothetical protein [Chlamydiales bacterium]